MQLFIHDPDNTMIEICNCEDLPLVLLNPSHSASLAAHNLLKLDQSHKVCVCACNVVKNYMRL